MKNILKVLQDEHEEILSALHTLLSVKEGCPGGRVGMEKLESIILNHVSREDAQVYAPLKKISTLTSEASKFLERSRRHLESLKILALVFFEKYKDEDQAALCRNFHGDLERLAKKFEERMDFEDKELFPFLTNLWAKL